MPMNCATRSPAVASPATSSSIADTHASRSLFMSPDHSVFCGAPLTDSRAAALKETHPVPRRRPRPGETLDRSRVKTPRCGSPGVALWRVGPDTEVKRPKRNGVRSGLSVSHLAPSSRFGSGGRLLVELPNEVEGEDSSATNSGPEAGIRLAAATWPLPVGGPKTQL